MGTHTIQRGGRHNLVDPDVLRELQYRMNELLYDLPPEPCAHDDLDSSWMHTAVGVLAAVGTLIGTTTVLNALGLIGG